MELILFGAALIGLSLWLNWKRPLPPPPPPRIRGALVDYSFGRSEMWGALAAHVPDAYDIATTALLGQPVYDAALARAIAISQQQQQQQQQPVQRPPEPGLAEGGPRPVYFKDGEPQSLSEYEGQTHVVEYLKAVVTGLPAEEAVPKEHQLFLGPAGLGKTLLAKCFANELALRNERQDLPAVWFQEEFPADLPDLKSLDRAVRKASERPTILFIDEIHDLKTEGHALKLYLLMEENRYKFEGDPFPTEIPNVCVIGATTDYGALHAALQRRFNRHALMPLTKDQISSIVRGRTFPITPEATMVLVERTHFSGAPWEALQLYRQAMQFSRARAALLVQVEDIERVFESQQIDALGLRWMDRAVIRALLGQPKYRNSRDSGREFVCYAASESDTCVMAQVDKGEYRESIKPRLMSRGLLQIRPTYGQALTPRAVEAYGWLVKQV